MAWLNLLVKATAERPNSAACSHEPDSELSKTHSRGLPGVADSSASSLPPDPPPPPLADEYIQAAPIPRNLLQRAAHLGSQPLPRSDCPYLSFGPDICYTVSAAESVDWSGCGQPLHSPIILEDAVADSLKPRTGRMVPMGFHPFGQLPPRLGQLLDGQTLALAIVPDEHRSPSSVG